MSMGYAQDRSAKRKVEIERVEAGLRETFRTRDHLDLVKHRVEWSGKVIFALVGLPARGKSYIGTKIVQFMQWQGFSAKVFNVGKKRRLLVEEKHVPQSQSSSFFDSKDSEALHTRDQIALSVLDDLIHWMAFQDGEIAVFDATNTTKSRRNLVLHYVKDLAPYVNLIFLESICDDPEVLKDNLKQKATHSPDFLDMDFPKALEDLKKRIVEYEKVYETIVDDSLSYIKLINLQSKIVCNRIWGYTAHNIASYLMSIHNGTRSIWLLRAGKAKNSDSDDQNLLADPSLDDIGKYNSKIFESLIESSLPNVVCYTSVLKRAIQAVSGLEDEYSQQIRPTSLLNPLDSGQAYIGRGAEVQKTLVALPKEQRFRWRFPGGESQYDVAHRLGTFVKQIERHRFNVVIVSHLTTLQVLYGYFVGCPPEEFCYLDFPTDLCIQLTPSQYGWKETRTSLSTNETLPALSGGIHKSDFYAPIP